MTDNRTNGQLAERLRQFAESQEMDFDNPHTAMMLNEVADRLGQLSGISGEFSEAQVEAAAEAMHGTGNPWFAAYGDWGAAGFEIKQAFRDSARAALVAAQGAATPVNSFDTTAEREKNGGDSLHVDPQEPSGVTDANGHSWMAWNESGKNGTYCRSCGGWAGKVGNRQCSPAPVLPSSGVDEDKLAEVIARSSHRATDSGTNPRIVCADPAEVARAVAEWLKGQGR